MKISRAFAVKAVFLMIFSAAAHAQEASVWSYANSLDGQNMESPGSDLVKYSEGESMPLWYPQEIQEKNPIEIEEAKAVSYLAGDSVPIESAEAAQGDSALKEESPRKKKFAGYSEASAIPLASALADSVSTHIGINYSGLVEKNSLVNTSAAGLIGLFFVKAGVVYYFDQQEPALRKSGLKAAAGLWSGVTMNNILLIAGASNPVSIVVGVLFGAYMYHREGLVLEKEEATRNAQ